MKSRTSEKFIVSCVTRGDVAEHFNQTIAVCEDLLRQGRAEPHERELASVAKFKSDDPRLTGRICQRFADAQAAYDDSCASGEEALAEVEYKLILEAARPRRR